MQRTEFLSRIGKAEKIILLLIAVLVFGIVYAKAAEIPVSWDPVPEGFGITEVRVYDMKDPENPVLMGTAPPTATSVNVTADPGPYEIVVVFFNGYWPGVPSDPISIPDRPPKPSGVSIGEIIGAL